MKVNDLIQKLYNGATKIIIYCPNTGEILFKGIWFNDIKTSILDREVKDLVIEDYLLKINVI